jgi:Flp pilus assembly protein TadG
MATSMTLIELHMHVRRLRKARRGNVLFTFALALIPIMGAVGAAVDYSRANNIRSQIIAAADAASVGSVAKSSPAVAAALAMSNDGAIPAGVTDALKIFNAQLTGKSGYYNNLSAITTFNQIGTALSNLRVAQ